MKCSPFLIVFHDLFSLFAIKPVNAQKFRVHCKAIFEVGIFWIFLILAYKMQLNNAIV